MPLKLPFFFGPRVHQSRAQGPTAEAIPGSAPDPTGRGIATFLSGKGVPGLDLGNLGTGAWG